MIKTRLVVVVSPSLTLAVPAFGKTYKNTYPVACSEVWVAVKDVLGNPENYTVTENDDAQMKASYAVKHTAHVNISGTLLQRTNHVTLLPQGNACQMQVVSNYSGWEHNDKDDFRTRVDESLAKLKAAPPAAGPAAEPAKPATPAN